MMLLPRPQSRGGVTHFCEVIMAYSDLDFQSQVRGRTAYTNKLLRYVVALKDYLTFTLKLIFSRPDIIHVNTSLGKGAVQRDAGFARIAKTFGIPIYLFIHGWEPEYEQQISQDPRHTFRRNLMRADRIGVLSEAFRLKLKSWGYENPVDVERTFVGDELISDIDLEEKPLFNPDRTDLQIMFMSRLEPTKGFFELLHAVAKMDRPDVHLHIAGTGSAEKRLRQEVSELGLENQVTLHGHVSGEAKKQLLFKSDVFALPSYYPEGLPISLLEGMLFGMPLLASTAGGIAEIFLPGKMGIMLEEITDQRVQEAVQQFLSMPRGKIIEIGRFNSRYAQDHFLGSKAAERMKHLYQQTLQGKA